MRNLLLSASTLLLPAAVAMANLDLSTLYTQTVKQGQNWAYIDTKVDALDLEVEVNHGVVTTTATWSYTPGEGIDQTWRCVPVQCIQAPCPDQCEMLTGNSTPLDSLETTASMSLEDNTAITDMYLWVGATRVRAELQTRELASAQYEDIVKRRKDPALLETWGNGWYTLRVFPEKSGETRKIQVKFVQGMEDDKGGFGAVLPVLHSLAPLGNVPYSDIKTAPKKSIGKVSLKAWSTDGKTYSLSWPGLGEGKIGSTAINLAAANLEELKAGTLSGAPAACADCRTAWTSDKAGGHFGVKTLLMAKTLKLEDQPKDRCIILDVDASDPLAPERARKLALLSLKAYGTAPYAANLAMTDGKGGLSYVFDAPVDMDAENLAKAFAAIKAWSPVAKADAHAALGAFAKGRKPGSPIVAFLINNEPYPYYPYPQVYDPAIWKDVEAKARAFEEAQAARAAKLAEVLKAANAMLFGFWNDWHLNLASEATGGYNLGGVYGWIYQPYYGRGAVDILPVDPSKPLKDWPMPPLFGPGRPDAYGLQDLKVTVTGMAVTDLVVLQNAQRYWIYARNLMAAKRSALAKSADFVAGFGGVIDSLPVRIGGKFAAPGKATILLTGLWGGLKFSQQFSVELSSAGARSDGAAIWAYQQSEAWGRDEAKDDIAAIQKLGRDYHVVNRQISLLALEPGMALWTDMPAKPGSGGTLERASNLKADGLVAGGGMNVDASTLEDILGANVSGLLPGALTAAVPGALTARPAGGALELAWEFPARALGERARFRILDVTGRPVADLAAARGASGFSAKWAGARPGVWLLRAECGGTVMTRRITVTR